MSHEERAELVIYGETVYDSGQVGGRWKIGDMVCEIVDVDGRTNLRFTAHGLIDYEDHGNYDMAVGGFLRHFLEHVIDADGHHQYEVDRIVKQATKKKRRVD